MALTYGQAHMNVVRQRGKAKTHPCRGNCGKQAREWAFLNRTNTAYQVEVHLTEGRAHICLQWISESPADYIPLCRACHNRLDNGLRVQARQQAKDASAALAQRLASSA